MPKDRRSRDQKRKAKLAERKQRQRQNTALVYTGSKYKHEKYVPIWFPTEAGVYDAYVKSGRMLTDRTVVDAIETLIHDLRAGNLAPLGDTAIVYEAGREAELVIQCIRRRWERLFDQEHPPVIDDLVGILRSMLGSPEMGRRSETGSQRYVQYIASFISQKVGASARLS